MQLDEWLIEQACTLAIEHQPIICTSKSPASITIQDVQL